MVTAMIYDQPFVVYQTNECVASNQSVPKDK